MFSALRIFLQQKGIDLYGGGETERSRDSSIHLFALFSGLRGGPRLPAESGGAVLHRAALLHHRAPPLTGTATKAVLTATAGVKSIGFGLVDPLGGMGLGLGDVEQPGQPAHIKSHHRMNFAQ